MALMLAAAAMGCRGPAVAAGPPPPGGPGGPPPDPPPRSPIVMLRSSSNLFAVRGCCDVMAIVGWVVV